MAINTGYTEVNGTTTGSYNMNYVRTWMEYKVLSQDIVNNTTTIDVKLYSQVQAGGSAVNMAVGDPQQFGHAGYDGVNKADYTTGYNYNNFALNKFFDGNLVIPHNPDGTRTVKLQANFTTISTTITGGSVVTPDIVLNTIPKASTLTNVTNRYYNKSATFEINRQASTLREKVTISKTGYSQVIKDTDNDATSFTFAVPYTYNGTELVPNTAYPSASTFNITVQTYSGATLIATNAYTYSWELASDASAEFAPTVTNPTARAYNDSVSALDNVAVAGYSRIRVDALASAVSCKHGADVASRVVTFDNGDTLSDKETDYYISGRIMNAGVHSWTYTITDTRGFTKTINSADIGQSVNFINYTAPTLDIDKCYRGLANQTADESGAYIWVKASASYDSCGTKNTLLAYTAQATGFSAVSLTNNTLVAIASTASASSAYQVTFTLRDRMKTITVTRDIPASDLPIVIRENGHGVGIGHSASASADVLAIGYETIAYDDVTVASENNSDNYVKATNDKLSVKGKWSATIAGVTSLYDSEAYITANTSAGGSFRIAENRYRNGAYNGKYDTKLDSVGLYIQSYNSSDSKTYEGEILNSSLRFYDYARHNSPSAWVHENYFKIDERYALTCNLLDVSLIEQGYLTSSGEEGTDGSISPSYVKSDFFKVSANTTYTFSCNLAQYGLHFFEYNENKIFIRYTSVGQGLTTPASLTTGAGTVYIRVQINIFSGGSVQWTKPSDITWAQVEKGSKASSYVPCTRSGTEVVESLDDINTSMKWILRNGQTAQMKHQPLTYFGCKLFGYVGGYGGVELWLRCSAGNVTVWDRDANAAWSRTDVLNIAYDSVNGIFTFYCGQYGICLLLLGC